MIVRHLEVLRERAEPDDVRAALRANFERGDWCDRVLTRHVLELVSQVMRVSSAWRQMAGGRRRAWFHPRVMSAARAAMRDVHPWSDREFASVNGANGVYYSDLRWRQDAPARAAVERADSERRTVRG